MYHVRSSIFFLSVVAALHFSLLSAASQSEHESEAVRPLVIPTVEASEQHADESAEPALSHEEHEQVAPAEPAHEEHLQVKKAANQEKQAHVPATGELPQAPQPKKPEDMPEKEIEPQGIDTVNVEEPEGNWLFKRIWWEKSKQVYGKIRDRVDKIVEARLHFYKERTKLNREILDPFYVDMGLDQAGLQAFTDYLLELIEKFHDKEDELSDASKEKFLALQEEKPAITNLSDQIKNIDDLDKKLRAALDKVMGQIDLARSYEGEAWQQLDHIAEELNDKKARERYYIIATLWRNVKEVGNYIQGPFAQHFVQVAQAIVQNVQNIRNGIKLLDQKGFSIKERPVFTLKAEEKPAEPEEDEDEEDVWPKKELSWGDWLWKKLTGWFSW